MSEIMRNFLGRISTVPALTGRNNLFSLIYLQVLSPPYVLYWSHRISDHHFFFLSNYKVIIQQESLPFAYELQCCRSMHGQVHFRNCAQTNHIENMVQLWLIAQFENNGNWEKTVTQISSSWTQAYKWRCVNAKRMSGKSEVCWFSRDHPPGL